VPEHHRSILLSIAHPADLGLSARHLAQNVGITALLVLLLACPSALFDSTLLGNYDEISGWFRRTRGRAVRAQERLARLPATVVLAGFSLCAAAIYGFLDPHFGPDRASAALFVGMAAALFLISATYDLARGYYMQRYLGERGRLVLYPVGLMIGALFVVMSRLAHFTPGYVFGIFTALTYTRREPSDEEAGRGIAVASLWLLALGALAWVASIPVADAAAKPDAGFLVLSLDSMLAILWVAGLQAIVFGLLPLRLMYGQQVWAWSRKAWAAIWLLGVFGFVYAFIHPAGGIYGTSPTASFGSVMLLFGAFALLSLAFWAYFRFRPTRAPVTAT
jgi:hypothetical protein